MKVYIEIVFILVIFLSIFLSCEPKKEVVFNDKGEVTVNPKVYQEVEDSLKNNPCMAVFLGDKEYLSLCDTVDTLTNTNIFLKSNTYLLDYDYITGATLSKDYTNFSYWAVANKNGKDSSMTIEVYHTLTTNDYLSSCFFNIDKKNVYQCERKAQRGVTFRPLKSELILDKKYYNIGDTLYGKVNYEEVEVTFMKNWLKSKFYFKCIVGSNLKTISHFKTNNACQGNVFLKSGRVSRSR